MDPWIGKIPWKRAWQPTLVFSLGESHGQRSLENYSPWGLKEWDMTETLSTAQHSAANPEWLIIKVYIYIYTHTCIHIYTYTHTHIYIYTYTYIYIFMFIFSLKCILCSYWNVAFWKVTTTQSLKTTGVTSRSFNLGYFHPG